MGVDAWTRTSYERAWQNGQRPTDKQRDMPHAPRTSTTDKVKGWMAGERKCHCGCGEFGTRFRGGQLMCRTAARINDSKANSQAQGPQDRTPPNPRRWL
jgi:hypothetical protein